jgi:hypothetical protein
MLSKTRAFPRNRPGNEKMNVKNGTTRANHAKNVLRTFVIGKELGAFRRIAESIY